MTNTSVMHPKRTSRRATGILLLLSGLLASCPSEPNPASQPEDLSGLQPAPASRGSAIDQVDVVSPVEALDTASQEIDGENVLDELNDLEGEMEGN